MNYEAEARKILARNHGVSHMHALMGCITHMAPGRGYAPHTEEEYLRSALELMLAAEIRGAPDEEWPEMIRFRHACYRLTHEPD